MRVIRFILEIFLKFPGLMISNVLLLVIVNLLGTFSLLMVSPVIDFVIHPAGNGVSPLTQRISGLMSIVGISVNLTSLVIILLVCVSLASGIQVFAQYYILKMRFAFEKDMLIGSFRHFFNANWYFFSSSKQGTLINSFTNELTIVGSAFGMMGQLSASMLQFVCFLIVPLFISWEVTLISLGMAVIFALPFILQGKINYRMGKMGTAAGNELRGILHENLGAAKIVLGFGNQVKNVDKLAENFDNYCKFIVKSQTMKIIVPILYRPLAVLTIVISLFAARIFSVELSEIAVLLLALFSVANAISNITMYKNSLDNFFPSYQQIKDLQKKSIELKQVSGIRSFNSFKKEISIRSLSFAYPGHPEILSKINMNITKGAMVALVGKSGAGKSTLIDLIMGFHQPSQGTISFDDTPLPEFDVISYRKRIGYVPQESILFNMSIKDNLLWANDRATPEDLERACRLAYAQEFIQQFPEGYNTLVGDRGVRLSGGQIQRIALARALLRNPELLILDEATSALDTSSEKRIQQAIENVAKQTTLIVVAHRLSTIKKADCIYVLERGRVIEHGPYTHLTQIDGHFSSMVQLQELEVFQ